MNQYIWNNRKLQFLFQQFKQINSTRIEQQLSAIQSVKPSICLKSYVSHDLEHKYSRWFQTRSVPIPKPIEPVIPTIVKKPVVTTQPVIVIEEPKEIVIQDDLRIEIQVQVDVSVPTIIKAHLSQMRTYLLSTSDVYALGLFDGVSESFRFQSISEKRQLLKQYKWDAITQFLKESKYELMPGQNSAELERVFSSQEPLSAFQLNVFAQVLDINLIVQSQKDIRLLHTFDEKRASIWMTIHEQQLYVLPLTRGNEVVKYLPKTKGCVPSSTLDEIAQSLYRVGKPLKKAGKNGYVKQKKDELLALLNEI